MTSSGLITVIISIFVAAVLVLPLHSGEISIGMLMGFITATFSLVLMVAGELTNITGELANQREYLHDLTAYAKLSETIGATDSAVNYNAEPQYIEFRDVSFSYPDTDKIILKNLSFKLLPYKHYAFVGLNGAGKTTITKLLTGLYNNYTGEIFIGNKNLRDFTQAELKGIFSVVYQDFAKYQISLLDSILLGNPQASMKDITEILDTIGYKEIISKLPEGLSSQLGRIKANAVDLSGGEWQKVAITRSLISHAPIHIMDEPTAALDPIIESEIYELFAKISKRKSTLLITHRLGAVKLADEILVIADGKVHEKGSHEELMAKKDLYSEMYEAQRGWYK